MRACNFLKKGLFFLVLTLFLRTLLVYVMVLVAIRLMGKREVGQLSVFDLVVAIMIAEIAVIPLGQMNVPLYMALISIAALVGAEIFFSFLCLKKRSLRTIIEGSPSVLIHQGKIMEQEMRKLRYNMDDLLTQLRIKDVVDLSDVEYAILETSGELSVILKSDRQPLTPRDLKMDPPSVFLPVPLIFDGEIYHENLKSMGLDKSWLHQELLQKKELCPESILFASYHPQREFYISLKEKNDCE